ncbi:precorrin-2 dehydrogenase/sirohydrochlorin ferrochelatase family protein [Marinisporobacter balticus]|uniref:precorrin-2 dehydrogenase n=1 Tax=Marinisporobacter balticus TaxID=2018667 RepID=A0A4R2L605_9FIRM|nr:bifunctional precorrin-2 dehydrogenase/sirohydrochlorin ferrochelatase [Marinisporobacter balticus]TCO79489.1 precorrin-2 dehydrogenase [Marinisporobacter balticus]
MDKYYPVMLDICDKPCVVIGGGKVAQRKVLSLLEYGAKVTVISPIVTDKLKELQQKEKIYRIERDYRCGDIKDNFLVYVATDNPKVNAACLEESRKEKVLINIADQPRMCSFLVPASIKRGDLTLTISTNGKSPMLSGKIRKELENMFGEEYEIFINALGDLRKMALEEIDDIHIRKELFKRVVYSNLMNRYKSGEINNIKEAVMKLYDDFIKEIDF